MLLAEIVVERDAAPVTVVGHSYGGGVAIELAARRPELVAGLVLVGSIGRAESLNVLDRAPGRAGDGRGPRARRGCSPWAGSCPACVSWWGPNITAPSSGCEPACPTSATTGSRRRGAGRCGGASWPSNEPWCARSAPSRPPWARCAVPTVVDLRDLGPGGAPVGVGQHRGVDSRQRARERRPHRAFRSPRRSRGGGRRRCATSSPVPGTAGRSRPEYDTPS